MPLATVYLMKPYHTLLSTNRTDAHYCMHNVSVHCVYMYMYAQLCTVHTWARHSQKSDPQTEQLTQYSHFAAQNFKNGYSKSTFNKNISAYEIVDPCSCTAQVVFTC